MIKGRKRQYAPYFDTSNLDFEAYLQMGAFSLDLERYFIQREEIIHFEPWEKPSFDIEFFYDVLCAPYFILKNEGNSYPPELKDLFYKLFPDKDDFETALNGQFDNALNSFKKETPYKEHFISHIQFHATKVNALRDKIAAVEIEKINPWLTISLKVIDRLQKELDHLESYSNVIPKDVLEYDFYLRIPTISWHGNPWGFFINLNFAAGFNLLKDDWQFSYDYSQGGTFEEYVVDQMKRQAIITSTILLEKLKKEKYHKQKIISEACKQFVAFYRLGEKKNFSKEYLSAYSLIIREIQKKYSKKKYSKIKYPLDGIKVEEVFFKRISDSGFLKRVLKKSKELQGFPTLNPLFGSTVTPDILLSLMLGDYDKFDSIEFNADNGAPVYYFLLQCKYQEGAHFEIHTLINQSKIKFRDTFLSRSGYDTYKNEYGIRISKLKKGAKIKIPTSYRLPYHDYIDYLFT